MKEKLLGSIIPREVECIQSSLQQVDKKKNRRFVYKEKINKMLQNMELNVILQQPLGNLNRDFLI